MAFMKKNSCSSKSDWGTSAKKQLSPDALRKMTQDRAYFVWQEKGRPQGQDREIWLQAEKEISRKHAC